MKKALIAILLVLFAVLVLFGQTADLWGLFWNGATGRWAYYQLGSGFSVTGSTVSVTAPAASARVYGVKLDWGAGGYVLPPGSASNVAVWVNGLRYRSPDDYSISGGVVTPACTPGEPECNWPPPERNTVVVVDYDAP